MHDTSLLSNKPRKLLHVVASKKFPEFAGKIHRNCCMREFLFHKLVIRLRDAIRRKHSEIWTTNWWFLLHDNAAAHRSVLVRDFLAKNKVTTLEHPPSSTDLAAADLYLFPRLKSVL
jgi:hypothetical protein